MDPSYKLTKYSIGSVREIWTISWPLMLGLLSGSFMLFADRFLLARYSTDALNACATSGMASYALMILPLITAGISEVFVGRCHGANQMKEVGKPVWQMIWLSLMTTPFFFLSAHWLSALCFDGTGNEVLETIYFRWILYFAPAFCSTVALMGFFIGIGQVKMITICTVLGNALNVVLAYFLVFGYGPFPELGIKGAAISTGLSQIFQTLFLMGYFLQKTYREEFGTTEWKFNWNWFNECLRIGAPAGLGRFLEILAHFIFFRIVILSGTDNLTIITVVQSFYLLLSFIVEGLSKGVSTIVANLIGGHQGPFIDKVIRSALGMQIFFGLSFGFILLLFSRPLLTAFFSEADQILLENEAFLRSSQWALFWMSVFYLLDGFAWIYAGVLTAGGDTKFLLYAGIVLNWVFYILPAYLVLGIAKGTAVQGWIVMTVYASLMALTYYLRYRSEKWLVAPHLGENSSINHDIIIDFK